MALCCIILQDLPVPVHVAVQVELELSEMIVPYLEFHHNMLINQAQLQSRCSFCIN